MAVVVYFSAMTTVLQCVEELLRGTRETSKGLMHRSRVIHPLQDIVGLSSPWHSRLNPKYVGTGLGHKPVYTETKAKKGEGREGTQTW